jgi:hypothetical protein
MPFAPNPIDFSVSKRSVLAIHSEPAASPSAWTADSVQAQAGPYLDRLNKDVWEIGDVVEIESTSRAVLGLKPDAENTDSKLKKYLVPGKQLIVKVHFGNDDSQTLTLNIVS